MMRSILITAVAASLAAGALAVPALARDPERRQAQAREPDHGVVREHERRPRWDDDGQPRRFQGPALQSDRAAPARRGYLPDSYRGGLVEDYPRYRLRPPPHGYAWVRIGGGFALVSLDDGRIFDRVP